MPADLSELFDDWAARVARGEEPDPVTYLDRAGPEREELARLMDAYLQSAPRREPDPVTLNLARSWVAGASPLAELRAHRGIRRDEIVEAIVGEFALDPAKAPVVKRYYHELEAGIIDPSRLSRGLVDLLSVKLGVARETILAWRARSLTAAPAFRSEVDFAQDARASPSFPAEDDDQIRNLFLSGR